MKDKIFPLINEGRLEEAEDLLAKENITSKTPGFQFVFAVLQFRKGMYRDALAIVENILETPDSPSYRESLLLKGFILKELRDWQFSREAFLQFYSEFSDDPHKDEALFLAGLTLEEEEKFEEAVALYEKAEQECGENYLDEILYRCAFCLNRLEEWSRARDKYLQLLEKFPEHARIGEIYFLIGTCYLRQNAFEKAGEYLEKASEITAGEKTFLKEMTVKLLDVTKLRSLEAKRVQSRYDPFS